MSKKIAVILAGSGVKDGSEIHESVLSLYFLDKYGAEIICAAPDKNQACVVNHLTGETTSEKRNMLVEAARIARGNIRKLTELRADEVDGALIPGGYGTALNLCDFAKAGDKCEVDPDLSRFLRALHSQKKPIAALCIAPAIIARLFGPDHNVSLTIGTDSGTASKLQKMGARHINKPVDDIAYDEKNKVITTPCYMLARSIKEVGAGAEKAVKKLLEVA